MAYKDSERGLHADSVGMSSGDPHNPDGYIAATLDFKNGPQALPTTNVQHDPGANQPGNMYPYQGRFDKESFAEENLEMKGTSPEYDNVPNPVHTGAIPDPGGGNAGTTLDFNSIAPVEFPFPKDPPLKSKLSSDPRIA